MKTVVVVFDPVHPYTKFKVYQNFENAVKDLENDGFTIDFWGYENVDMARAKGFVYKKAHEQRFVYERKVEDCEENKNYLSDKLEDLAS